MVRTKHDLENHLPLYRTQVSHSEHSPVGDFVSLRLADEVQAVRGAEGPMSDHDWDWNDPWVQTAVLILIVLLWVMR